MDPTIVLGVIIAVLIVIIIMLLISGGKSGENTGEHQAQNVNSGEKFNTTFTPNSAPNQTAPLVKGKKKQKPILNEEQLATAGKDETFLPQTTSSAQDTNPIDDDDDALTKSAKRS